MNKTLPLICAYGVLASVLLPHYAGASPSVVCKPQGVSVQASGKFGREPTTPDSTRSSVGIDLGGELKGSASFISEDGRPGPIRRLKAQLTFNVKSSSGKNAIMRLKNRSAYGVALTPVSPNGSPYGTIRFSAINPKDSSRFYDVTLTFSPAGLKGTISGVLPVHSMVARGGEGRSVKAGFIAKSTTCTRVPGTGGGSPRSNNNENGGSPGTPTQATPTPVPTSVGTASPGVAPTAVYTVAGTS